MVNTSKVTGFINALVNKFALKNHTHDYLSSNDVVDNLTSTSSTTPLSANQGKVLDGKILGSDVFYGTCSTAAATQTKVVTVNDWSFTTGNVLFVKFTNAQTYNGTAILKIGDVSTNVVSVGTTTTSRYYWKAGELVGFVYDGTNFTMLEKAPATTTYFGVTKLSSSVTSTSESLAATAKAVKTAYDLADGKADASHEHTVSDVTDFPSLSDVATSGSYDDLTNKPTIPTVPTNVSAFTNDSGYLTSHQDISGKLDIAQTSYKGKNVVVDSSTGNITFENKPNIPSKTSDLTNDSNFITSSSVPSASSTTPFADTTSGAVGTGTTYARADHKHSKSSLYAESSHTHTDYNKATYSQTIASTTTGAYEIGKITIDGTVTTVYGKDTNTEYAHPTYTNVAKSTSALYKIKTNSLGHIIEITEATSTDIANLGVEITDTVYTHPTYTSKTSGLYKITVDGTGHISGTASVTASDLPSHTHSISNITNLQSSLDGKAASTHSHNIFDLDPISQLGNEAITQEAGPYGNFIGYANSLLVHDNDNSALIYDKDGAFNVGNELATMNDIISIDDVLDYISQNATLTIPTSGADAGYLILTIN